MSNITLPTGTKKIIFSKSEIKDEVKAQKTKYIKDYRKEEKKNNFIHDDNFNAYLFNINKKYFIVDVDTEHALNYIKSLFIKYDINNNNITKSISNFKKGKEKINPFKFHIYFKNNLNIEKDNLIDGLDLLTNRLIFEDSKQFNNNINLDELPELNEDFYNDLLLYKPLEEEKQEAKKEEKEKEIIKPKEKPIKFKINNYDIYNDVDDITNDTDNKIIDLLNILNKERARRYCYWFKIGQIIYNINPNKKHIFNNYSKEHSGELYNEDELNLKWNEYINNSHKNHNNNKLTIGTLIYYAKNDNNEAFKIWNNKYNNYNIKFDDYYNNYKYNTNNSLYNNINKSKVILKYITNDLKGNIADHDYGRIFRLLFNNFIYSNEKLYYFNGIVWKQQSKINADLIKYISINLYNSLSDIIEKEILKHETENKNNETPKEEILIKIQYLSGIKSKFVDLKNNKTRKNIINSILAETEDNNIIFDSYYPDLIAFNNAIYDLKNKCFIEAKPEFYMSMSTGYDYIFYNTKDEKDKEEARKKEILNLLNSIFPNKEIRDYYLMLLSQGMGGHLIELFVICTGSGGNGKSLLHEFFISMLGEYGYNLPNQILSHDMNNTGGPNPALANMHLKRFILTSEPEATKRLKCATIKDITGKPGFNARTCHETNTNKLLAMSLFLECNEKPLVDMVDDGLARRLRVINFNSKFLNEDDYNIIINEINNNNELKQDEKESFKKKYGIINRKYKTNDFKIEYRQTLFNILVDYYNNYNDKNEKIPQEVKKEANIYMELSGDIIPFINDHYYKPDDYLNKKSEAEKYKISLVSLFDEFKKNDLYINMTKEAKRTFNKSKFSEKMEKYFPIDFRADRKGTKYLFNYTLKDVEEIKKSDFDLDFED